jgi:hypothetical protein
VQDRPVLNIAARPDANPVHVAANDRARPNAGVLANRDVANNYGRRIDVRRGGDLRPSAAIAADHSLTSVLRPIQTRAIALLMPEARLEHKHVNLAHAEFTDKKVPTKEKCHSERSVPKFFVPEIVLFTISGRDTKSKRVFCRRCFSANPSSFFRTISAGPYELEPYRLGLDNLHTRARARGAGFSDPRRHRARHGIQAARLRRVFA